MALSSGNPHLKDSLSDTAGGFGYIDIDYGVDGTGATATPDAFLAVGVGQGVEVIGSKILTAGTTNADLDIGVVDASGGAVDVDGFSDGVDLDDAADTVEQSGGAYTLLRGGIYWNFTAATVYLAGTNLTAAAAAGKIRIYLKTHALPAFA